MMIIKMKGKVAVLGTAKSHQNIARPASTRQPTSGA
jgi:hypothetical protein